MTRHFEVLCLIENLLRGCLFAPTLEDNAMMLKERQYGCCPSEYSPKLAHCRKPLNRRFIVVEGICKASGDITPLDKVTILKGKYKFRLVVDESYSFGVLGKTGRGACEHFNLTPKDVEIVCSSMGDFSARTLFFITSHQFLNVQGHSRLF